MLLVWFTIFMFLAKQSYGSEVYIICFQCFTAAKDSTLGTAHVWWERFDFNKDALLDEDEDEVEG
jgi:hypothetical protein